MPASNPLREMTPQEWAAYPKNEEEIVDESPTDET
jgi:hypothetical protein